MGHELIGEGGPAPPGLMDALRSVNYDGFLSLQWDPQWSEGYGDLEMILTHFAVTMSAYAREARRQNLYYSQTGEGQYVWKKDIVIDCTFPQVLDRMVEEFPDQYCFKYTTLDYTRTYSQFRDDVDQFARSLIAMGVKAGDKVAVWATNVPAWFITFWAATKIGAVLVTVNTALQDPRGGVPPPPVRHPHPGDDPGLPGQRLRRASSLSCARSSPPPSPASPSTASACPSCATWSPWASARPGA